MRKPQDNIKILPTVKSLDPPLIVVFLQGLLEQARSGEITGMLAVTTSEEGDIAYASAGIDDAFRVIGFMHHGMNLLLSEYEEE